MGDIFGILDCSVTLIERQKVDFSILRGFPLALPVCGIQRGQHGPDPVSGERLFKVDFDYGKRNIGEWKTAGQLPG
jgi:hypothetical protein